MQRLNEYLNRFVHNHPAELQPGNDQPDSQANSLSTRQVLVRELSQSFAYMRWFR